MFNVFPTLISNKSSATNLSCDICTQVHLEQHLLSATLCKTCSCFQPKNVFVISGTHLGIFENRGIITKKEQTRHFIKRIYLEITFFRFKNKRNLAGNFRISLVSCVTQISMAQYGAVWRSMAQYGAVWRSIHIIVAPLYIFCNFYLIS